MPREIEFAGVVVVPRGLLDGAEREIDAHRARIFVVYPDDTKGAELDDILKAVESLAKSTELSTK